MSESGKPIPVWIIVVYLGITVFAGLLGNLVYLVAPAEMKLPTRNIVDWLFVGLGFIIPAIIAIYLFRLRKVACYWCIVWCVLGVIGTSRFFLVSEATGYVNIYALAFSTFVLVSITGYTFFLFKSGRLK